MADSKVRNQQGNSSRGKDVGQAPRDEGLCFSDLLVGAQVGFVLRAMPPIPKAIESLKDRGLRQRGEEAWKSVFLLLEALRLWAHFLLFGRLGVRLNLRVDKQIGKVFPDLKDLGAVVEALAVHVKLTPRARAERWRLDKCLGIRRGRTGTLDREAKQRYRGKGLVELIQGFHRTMLTHAQCLNAVGVKSAIFEQPTDAVDTLLDTITRVDLDFTGTAPPLDFARTVRELPKRPAMGQLQRELERLGNLLTESPALAPGEASTPALDATRADKNADKRPSSRVPLPKNQNILRLAKAINDHRDQERSQNDIALQFTNGDEKQADTLLREVRRFPHLIRKPKR